MDFKIEKGGIVDKFGIKTPEKAKIPLKDGGLTSYSQVGLPFVSNNDAIRQSINTIDKEREGEQLGLYSPFSAIDRLQGKYWRFAQTNAIYSKTAHGKSYTMLQLVNAWTNFEDREDIIGGVPDNAEAQVKLEESFTDRGYDYTVRGRNYVRNVPAINKQFVEDGHKVILLNFSFEMMAQDEMIRNLSINTGKSVSNLYSSEFNVNTGKYNSISDHEYLYIKYHAKKLANRPIYFFEKSGNLDQIYSTYLAWKAANPDCKFIINLDHAGLVDKKEFQTDMGLMGDLAKLTIALRSDGCMVNIVCQMNANIVDPVRQAKPSTQHPVITDIHGSNQFGWAVDNAWCFPYRPEVEHLPFYGENKMRTKGLVIAAKVKSRHGSTGEVYLANELHRGVFVPLTLEQIEARYSKKEKTMKK